MYNEEKLYSVWSLFVVHILNFQRDLVVLRFMRIELVSCYLSPTDQFGPMLQGFRISASYFVDTRKDSLSLKTT